MSEMIERVSAAVAEVPRKPKGDYHQRVAMAAIHAMREPTPEMAKAMDHCEISVSRGDSEGEGYDYVSSEDAAKIFKGMIDVALGVTKLDQFGRIQD